MLLMKKWLSAVLVFTLLVGTISALTPQKVEAASSKLIALTFDDGCSSYTEELLDGLARYGAKATFFVVGNYGAAAHKDLLERMVREGHQIANHTANHVVPFSGLSITGMRNELDPVNDLLYDVMGGEYQTWVRIPGGDDSSAVRQTVESPIAYWSIDCQDWQVDDANYVYNALMSQAFDGCLALEKINIPKTTFRIGAHAFRNCQQLESIVLTPDIHRIEEGAFMDCKMLLELELPQSLLILSKNAFAHCISLRKITFNPSLKEIGESAFAQCRSLKELTFSDSLQVIGDYAFMECKNLKKLSFPATIKKIGAGAFQDCESLRQPLFPPEIELGKNAFKGTRK